MTHVQRNNNPAKNWCFTIANPVISLQDIHQALLNLDREVVAWVIGNETAPTTGLPHFQGYLQLSSKKRLNQVKALIPSFASAHFEVAKGSPSQNRDYCIKEGDFVEHNMVNATSAGQRTDLAAVATKIKNYATFSEIFEERPTEAIKYVTNILKVKHLIQKPRAHPNRRVILRVARSGCGKTFGVFRDHPELFRAGLDASSSGGWFDGYDGQSVALLDEFDGKRSHMGLKQMLGLLDVHPLSVPVKNGFVAWEPEIIYITSNFHPRDWYDWEGRMAQYSALKRRVAEVHLWRGWTVGDEFREPDVLLAGSADFDAWWEATLGAHMVEQPDGTQQMVILTDLLDA